MSNCSSIKTLDLIPSIYASGQLPKEIDLNSTIYGKIYPLYVYIERQKSRNLPFILSIPLLYDSERTLKTSRIFHFTINHEYEESFKYLGHSDERKKEKKAFLNAFLEANKGSKQAQTELASLYLKGHEGTEVNHPEAIHYLTLAGKQNDYRALELLTSCISSKSLTLENQKAAFTALKSIADDSKIAEAQYQLAKHLRYGRGCERKTQESIRYCILAASQAHKKALFSLAIYHSEEHYNHDNYETATVILKLLIRLNFRKEITYERATEWITQLNPNAPLHFLKAAYQLYNQILNGDNSDLI